MSSPGSGARGGVCWSDPLREEWGRALVARAVGLTKSSMASFMAEMLSTNTSGIMVAIGASDDTAGIS